MRSKITSSYCFDKAFKPAHMRRKPGWSSADLLAKGQRCGVWENKECRIMGKSTRQERIVYSNNSVSTKGLPQVFSRVLISITV